MPNPMLRDDGNGFAASNATPQDIAAMKVDALSPTLIAQKFLQEKGIPLTSENMRRALEANANNPGTIAGLVNNPPPPALTNNTPNAARVMPRPPMQVSELAGTAPPIPPNASNAIPTVENSTMPSASGSNIDLASTVGMAVLAGLPAILTKLLGGGNAAEFVGNSPVPPRGVSDIPPNANRGSAQQQIAAPSTARMGNEPIPIGGVNSAPMITNPEQLRALEMQRAQSGPEAIPMQPPRPVPGETIALPQSNGNERAAMRRATFPKVAIPPIRALRVP